MNDYSDETAKSAAPGSLTQLYGTLCKWIKRDIDVVHEWRKEAREAYDFYVGRQWSERDKEWLENRRRPAITFNRVGVMIRAVTGAQIMNPLEVSFKPRGEEDGTSAEILTNAVKWFHQANDGPDADNEAFMDLTVGGMGWTETRVDYDMDPDGDPVQERIDPFEMGWDYNARKKNLADARRIWRAREMTLGEAKVMFPDAKPDKLDASWARDGFLKSEGGRDLLQRDHYVSNGTGEDGNNLSDDDIVTIVHVEWWEMADRVVMPDGTNMKPEDHGRLLESHQQAMDAWQQQVAMMPMEPSMDPMTGMMMPPQAPPPPPEAPGGEPRRVRVYRQAFLGAEVLKEEEAAVQGEFRWKCMTGFRDQNKGYWYGLTRSMIDPQRMANKWLSQTIHLLNVSAKGGVMMERDAVDDPKQFEQSYARAEEISWLAEGGIGKFQQKPVAQFPSGFHEMTNFAIQSIRDASGVSQELMGMREANQPGILEDMRRQQGMMVLADLFRAMTLYRRQQGRLMLEMIRLYIPMERIQRIVGNKYPPEAIQAALDTSGEYDVIVDEMPMSVNQKEAVWSMISPIWSSLDPNVQKPLWKYAPLPESVAQEVMAAYDSFLNPPVDPTMQSLERANAKADAGMKALHLKEAVRNFNAGMPAQ